MIFLILADSFLGSRKKSQKGLEDFEIEILDFLYELFTGRVLQQRTVPSRLIQGLKVFNLAKKSQVRERPPKKNMQFTDGFRIAYGRPISNDRIQLKSPCVSTEVPFQMGLTLMAFLLMMMIMWDRTEPGAYRVDGKSQNFISLAFLIERVITLTFCAQFEMVKAIEIQINSV